MQAAPDFEVRVSATPVPNLPIAPIWMWVYSGRSSTGCHITTAQARELAQELLNVVDSLTPKEEHDSDDLLSMQPLGDTEVLVDYRSYGGQVTLNGVWIYGTFVDAYDFSQAQRDRWTKAITQEIAAAIEGAHA